MECRRRLGCMLNVNDHSKFATVAFERIPAFGGLSAVSDLTVGFQSIPRNGWDLADGPGIWRVWTLSTVPWTGPPGRILAVPFGTVPTAFHHILKRPDAMASSRRHRPDRRRSAGLTFLVAGILVHELYPPDRQAHGRDPNLGQALRSSARRGARRESARGNLSPTAWSKWGTSRRGAGSDPPESEVTRKTFRLHAVRVALRAFVPSDTAHYPRSGRQRPGPCPPSTQ